jgi:type IX secretion system PorP/SprF family membrane protein
MRNSIILFSLLFSLFSSAQDVRFNQVNLTSLYSNPALTGVNGERKITAAFRNQWPTLSASIRSTYVSYQEGISRFGNFGGYYLNSYYSNGAFNSNRIGLNYAKHFRLTRNLTMTPGLSGSAILDHINFSKLTFGDLANPRTGQIYDPLALKENTFSADFSAGVLLRWRYIFGGVSFNQFGSIGEKSMFNIYSNIGISLHSKKHELTIIPEISLNTMRGFYAAAVKVSAYYKWVKLGVEYNLRDGYSAAVGARLGRFNLAFSTEWIISNLSGGFGLSFGAGLSYQLRGRNCKNKIPSYTYSLF